ncbi:MAG: UDP-N-acetylmuramoyl-L-alanyl-D-glutamate--2,6-diaminopimelate ligase [Candidatus Omnitrophica bacterium]|nr:UDP-N-acetylmuramoyl-L-alanyl-D-glutamate--2,6-diaminopimelate ligase [Candidatus Omnitrophota bacterium]
MITLRDLLQGVSAQPLAAVPVTGIARHSKQVRPGDVFVAIAGASADGHAFIAEAVARGAAAVVSQRFPQPGRGGAPPSRSCPCIVVPDTRAALAVMAARFYGHPSRKLRLIGVTGTTGKTTTTYLLRSILRSTGVSVGMLGTVVYQIGGREIPSTNTTPGPLELQRYFAQMVGEGLPWCVMEASSHALDQGRLSGVEFDAAIFTNLGSDHLDYHKTPEAYAAAKRRIFEHLKPDGCAVLNSDDPHGRVLAQTLPSRECVTYGMEQPAKVFARNIVCTWHGIELVLESPWGTMPIATPLLGRHNVWNLAAAAAALLRLGVPLALIRRGLADVEQVPGRLERVPCEGGPAILVDYAHTADALRQALLALRELTRGRLIVVFGCGGDRDRTKRPVMGKMASLLADAVVLTSDNPRSEDPHVILQQIKAGFAPGFSQHQVVPDREQAIAAALAMARPEDTVVVAGKGHEAHQTVGHVAIPFMDRDVIERWVASRHAVAV